MFTRVGASGQFESLRPGGSEQSGWHPPQPGVVVDVFSHGKVARYRVALHSSGKMPISVAGFPVRVLTHYNPCTVPDCAHRIALRHRRRGVRSMLPRDRPPLQRLGPVRSCGLQLLLLAGCLGLCAVSRFTKRMVHVRRLCQVTPSPTAIPSYWVMRDSLECPKFSECSTELLATSKLAPFADKQEMSDRRDASGSLLFRRKINKGVVANMPVSLSN